MKRSILAILAFSAAFGLAAAARAADRCESWTHKEYPVTMEACSYKDGGSGYYRIRNNGSKRAAVCWTVVRNGGKEDNGCHSSLGAGEESSGSCFSCGSKNEGVKHILLRKYEIAR